MIPTGLSISDAGLPNRKESAGLRQHFEDRHGQNVLEINRLRNLSPSMFESGAENVKEREGINRDVQMMIGGECDRVRKFG